MKRPRISDEQVREWYARYEGGESIEAIARSTGRTGSTLYGIFKGRGLPTIERPKVMPKRVSDDLVGEMAAFYNRGNSLSAVARKWKRSPTSARALLVSRGYEIRNDPRGKAKRNEQGRVAALQPLTGAQIDELVEQATSFRIPAILKMEWRKWTISRRAAFIARIRAKLKSPKDRPELPFSSNLIPFDYGTERAHEIAGDSRKIKPSSQGVIWGGKLWFWVPNTGYIRGPWKAGMPSRILSRVVWEKHAGRSLPAGHVVRLKDGNPNNLSPDNLELATRNLLCRENYSAAADRRAEASTKLLLARHRKPKEEKKNDLTSQLLARS